MRGARTLKRRVLRRSDSMMLPSSRLALLRPLHDVTPPPARCFYASLYVARAGALYSGRGNVSSARTPPRRAKRLRFALARDTAVHACESAPRKTCLSLPAICALASVEDFRCVSPLFSSFLRSPTPRHFCAYVARPPRRRSLCALSLFPRRGNPGAAGTRGHSHAVARCSFTCVCGFHALHVRSRLHARHGPLNMARPPF